MMIDVAAVIIWYNPMEIGLQEIRRNVLSIVHYVRKIIIIDNSNFTNENIIKDIGNIEYIPLRKNYGIAYALNMGVKKVIEDGFTWFLSMDQDSYFLKEEIEKYYKLIEAHLINDVVSYAPLPSWKKNIEFYSDKDFVFVDKVITSGNIVNTEIFLNGLWFDESLFVYEVDNDLCYKIKQKNKKIILFPSVIMNHRVNEVKLIKIFSKKIVLIPYSCTAMYYKTRNLLYMKKTYPEIKIKISKIVFFDLLLSLLFRKNKLSYISHIIKGCFDFILNKKGEISKGV